MKLKEIYPGVIHVTFKTQYELCMSFLRLQEFYESPYKEIRLKMFSLEEYMDVCFKHTGNFTYPKDWSGFNIPGNIYNIFMSLYSGDNAKWSNKESKLFNAINNFITKRKLKVFYIIGTYKNDTIRHEIAHSFFYLNDAYRNEMKESIKWFKETCPNVYKKACKALLKDGYDKSVLEDEIQAYFSESRTEYFHNRYKVKISQQILKVFRKTLNQYLR